MTYRTRNSSEQVCYRMHNSYEQVQNSLHAICSYTYLILPDIDWVSNTGKLLLSQLIHLRYHGQLGRSDYQFTEFHNHTTEGTAYSLRAVKCWRKTGVLSGFHYFESFIQRVCLCLSDLNILKSRYLIPG